MKERKRDFLRRGSEGFWRGRRDIGGVPKVMQWILLKPEWMRGNISMRCEKGSRNGEEWKNGWRGVCRDAYSQSGH